MSTKQDVMATNRNRRYSVPELCEELGLSHFSLQRWRSQGSGPEYEKIGNRIFYRVDVVEQWRQSTGRSSTSDGPAESTETDGKSWEGKN